MFHYGVVDWRLRYCWLLIAGSDYPVAETDSFLSRIIWLLVARVPIAWLLITWLLIIDWLVAWLLITWLLIIDWLAAWLLITRLLIIDWLLITDC
jgi:hypothetical protein